MHSVTSNSVAEHTKNQVRLVAFLSKPWQQNLLQLYYGARIFTISGYQVLDSNVCKLQNDVLIADKTGYYYLVGMFRLYDITYNLHWGAGFTINDQWTENECTNWNAYDSPRPAMMCTGTMYITKGQSIKFEVFIDAVGYDTILGAIASSVFFIGD
jgi:hypothetical protein